MPFDGGLYKTIQAFSRDISEPLDTVLVDIAETLLQHARFSGKNLFRPDDSTHVVAVLGSIDLKCDDWFLSDFFLLQHILGGTAKSETWLMCVDPKPTIKDMGRPLRHGPPHNLKTLRNGHLHSHPFYTVVRPCNLAQEFLACIRSTIAMAEKGDRIIIITVAHGNEHGHVAIGVDPDGEHVLVSREDIEEQLEHDFDHEVKITIISTACYSGMWLLPLGGPGPKSTWTHSSANDMLLAAPPTDLSWSFLPSSTSSRYNGGPFVHALSEEFSKLAIPRNRLFYNSNPELNLVTSPVIPPAMSTKGSYEIPRAVSVGDIMVGSTISAMGTIGAWASSLQRRMRQITSHPESSPHFQFDNSSLPASMVLGGNRELSTLFRIEAVRTLPLAVDPQAQDNLTAIGLGIEEVVARSSKNLSKKVHRLLEARLGQRQVVSPEDAWFARIRVDIEQGRARRDDLKEANNLLKERAKADCRATKVVQYFHPRFTKDYPIQQWSGRLGGQTYYFLSKSEKESYAKVLEEFLFLHKCKDHCQKTRCTYSRPRQYVMAAAVDLELSPEGLAARLKPLSLPLAVCLKPFSHIHNGLSRRKSSSILSSDMQ